VSRLEPASTALTAETGPSAATAGPSDELLSVRDLHAYYGGSHVLQGVSLRVGRSEAVSVLGRNGAGKTTTISAIVGFLSPRAGTIVLAGADIARRPPHVVARHGIALVPQGRRVFPDLTVRENLVLTAHPGPWTLQRVLELFPALARLLDRRGGALSGGEQQMVAIGRALLRNPLLLALDEPSEGLAPQLVQQVGEVLAALRRDGLAILLVEQNLSLALKVADRVYVMNKGRIVFEGEPTTLRQSPAVLHQYLGV
jgi:branched-chain amino acid transport system ATP-binding protein